MTGADGALVIADKLVVKVGDVLSASGTIDLSGATLEISDPANLADVFTFLQPVADQKLAIIGVPAPANLPKGWKVSVSADGTACLVKIGMTVIVR